MENTRWDRPPTSVPRSPPPARKKSKKLTKRTQEERSATTRQKLIAAAIECLSEIGYLESTVDVVAKRAGVSRGAVQHHFGSRNDLLLAVVDAFGLALAEPAEIGRNLSVPARVDAAIEHTWELVRRPHFIAVVQIWLATRNIPDVVHVTGEKIAQFEHALDRRWQVLFSDIKVAPQEIAVTRHIVLAALRGLALRALYRKRRATWTREIAALKKMVVAAFS